MDSYFVGLFMDKGFITVGYLGREKSKGKTGGLGGKG